MMADCLFMYSLFSPNVKVFPYHNFFLLAGGCLITLSRVLY